jgi:hypothetical protein
MKDEVEEFIHSNRKCSDIVQDKLDKLDKDIKKRMPTTETLNRDMQRHRRRFVKDEKGPKRRDDIDLPEDCQKLDSGEDFLLHDSGVNDPERFFIFGTLKNVERLKRCSKVFLDGTFKRPKRLFAQVSYFD